MKIETLIRRTDSQRKTRAKYVRVLRLKTGRNAIGNLFIAGQTQTTHRFDGRFYVPVPPMHRNTYVTVIEFIDNSFNCRVACSCEDFKFREEVALWTRNAANIEYSNGAFPVITNPQLKPYVCKHTVALYEKVKAKLPRK